MADDIGSPIQQCSGKTDKKEEQDPKLHWIKFKLQDDKGNPMAGVTLNVTLPDGSSSENTSNNDGIIEIPNVQPGSCKIGSNWTELSIGQAVVLN